MELSFGVIRCTFSNASTASSAARWALRTTSASSTRCSRCRSRGRGNPDPHPNPHPNPNPNQVKGEGALTQDDKQMLEGALTFAEKQAQTRPVGARC